MSFISYSVGWLDSCRKFTVRELRSFKTQSVTTYGVYDTFRAAYDAARTLYNDLSKKSLVLSYLNSEKACCEALQGSWGMSQAQKEEISAYLSEALKTPQQGREEIKKPVASIPEPGNIKIDLTRFSEAQQRELQQGMDLDLPVWMYANPMYTPAEMARLRSVLQTTIYAQTHPEARVIATDHGPEEVGFGFKSYTNFEKHPDSVCYIPENWDFEEDGPGYTARDILDLCDGDALKAEMVFSLCDWQHPSTILGEWDIDDERALEQRRSEIALQNRAQAALPLSECINTVLHRQEEVNDKTFPVIDSSCETSQTRRLNVTIMCQAVYNSGIDVPINLSFAEALDYAKEHMAEIPLGSLEYTPDSDVLDEENCDFDDWELENGLEVVEEKVSLDDQIQSASSRVTPPLSERISLAQNRQEQGAPPASQPTKKTPTR